MHVGRADLVDHINVFIQLVANLVKVKVKADDEDMTIIIVCSLPRSYKHLVTMMNYAMEDINVRTLLLRCLFMMKEENQCNRGVF